MSTIYTLSFKSTPGERIEYTDVLTGEQKSYKVPRNGNVVFYVGDTGMSLYERGRKHKFYLNRLAQAQQKIYNGENVKHYPVYNFALQLGLTFDDILVTEIEVTDDQTTNTERAWIKHYRSKGCPMMNVNHTGKRRFTN